MTSDASDIWLPRIRQLLAQAESPAATPAEAETYTAKAMALIAKYGIDQALLANAGKVRDEVGDRIVLVNPPYVDFKRQLLRSVAVPMRVRTVYRKHESKDRTDGAREMHLFGFAADLERVEILYTSLLTQGSLQCAAIRPIDLPTREVWDEFHGWVSRTEDIKSYRRSWWQGFGEAIYTRLSAAESTAQAEAEKTSTGTDIVLRDRNALVQERQAEFYPRLSQSRRPTTTGSGREAGRAAGQRADLGGTRLGAASGRSITR